MLSLDKVKGASAAAAADYFLDLNGNDVGDYYLGEDGQPAQAKARVLGNLGKALGLAETATYEQVLHLLDGRHPLTGKRLIPWRPDRVSAIDMTASAPKSVSVLWALGDDQVRRQVQAAQDTAVAKMVAYIEQSFHVVRRQGERMETGDSVLAVSFAHHTSRQSARAAGLQVPPDPQLHTHVLLMMARRKDGQFVTIGNRQEVWRRRMEAMAVYHSALAGELAELGFPIQRRTGRGRHYFEVAGIPVELRQLWSSRRKEIGEHLETWSAEFRAKYGRDPDMVEQRAPAVRSRIKKGSYPVRDLLAFWKVVGEHEGVTEETLAKLRRQGTTLPGRAFAEALLSRQMFGPEGALTGQQATFSTQQARTATLECAAGLLTPRDALQWLEDRCRDGEITPAATDVWTTREILGLEQAVLRWNDGRQAVPSPPPPTQRQVWDALRQQQRTLSGEQLEALRTMLGSRTTYVTGEAGTGKGVVVHAAADVWRSQGRRVFALALAGATAQRLAADLGDGVETMTLRGLVVRTQLGRLRLSPSDVLVVDEAGMVDTRLWAAFAEAVGDGPTVVAIGDHAQLSPIGAGGLWPLLSRDGPRLTEVRRTDLAWEQEAWGRLRVGDASAALWAYARRGNLSVSATRAEAIQRAVEDWSRDGHRGLIITDATNAERHTASQAAQNRRLQAGELGTEAVTFSTPEGAVELRAGDRVIFRGIHRPAEGCRVENGTTGSVYAACPAEGAVLVETNESRPRTLAIPQAAALDLYYATHVYKAQGATLDHAYIVAGGWQTSRESLYVACSRSRQGSYLYLDRETLERGIDADALHAAATRASRSRAKVAASAYGVDQVSPRGNRGRRAPQEALVIQWQRRHERRAAARARPASLPSFWEAMVGDVPPPPSPAAVAFSEGIAPWAAQAVQNATGRAFGASA